MKIITQPDAAPAPKPRAKSQRRMTDAARNLQPGQSLIGDHASIRCAASYFRRIGARHTTKRLPKGNAQLWLLAPAAPAGNADVTPADVTPALPSNTPTATEAVAPAP